MGNIVCHLAQTQSEVHHDDRKEGHLHESCVAACGESTVDLRAGRQPVRTAKGNAFFVSD